MVKVLIFLSALATAATSDSVTELSESVAKLNGIPAFVDIKTRVDDNDPTKNALFGLRRPLSVFPTSKQVIYSIMHDTPT
ncbi:hypothetical protein H257_03275 [Aphanomyces astaci]|uniref:RxLR effector protein n=1 Tax=Aphanomyces astaci TaxID=112090 RepID=W4H112_APHAT|nr:hypothetical protein H257_03275 [Aphanomyces astaci]ETV85567.1 hypothetical protein H257_03275 [Aphanomyces astaci]|eukprot:XP_009825585.1 hypothetical protein H257_03275 [Aphanomyces astaci]